MEAANDTVDPTHALLAPELPRLPSGNLQALMFDCIEDGPESLIPLIEAEFGRRGLDPYANGYPANDA